MLSSSIFFSKLILNKMKDNDVMEKMFAHLFPIFVHAKSIIALTLFNGKNFKLES